MENLIFIKIILIWALLPARAALWGRDDFRRQVSMELNPGRTAATPGADLLHVRALGPNDTLHLLLSTNGAPTLLLLHSNSSHSTIHIDWPAFLARNSSHSLRVEPENSVVYSSALVFSRLLEYEDVNNTADPEDLPESSFLPPYDLQNFTWNDLNSTLDHTHHTALLCGWDTSSAFNNASLCLQFAAFESEGREEAWPSLLHNANSSQLRMWLEGVEPRTNQSRFSLELQTVMEEGFQARVDIQKFIDDEYTPSIFQVSRWVSSQVNSSSVGGFSQWKPVAYRQRVPVLEDATPCRNTPPISLTQHTPSGLVSAYFPHGYLTSGINVSFGMAEDPYYSSTHFISWTVLVGMGSPPSDVFSALVMGIIAVGLGTPLALIVVGGVYVCIRKKREEQLGYQPIS